MNVRGVAAAWLSRLAAMRGRKVFAWAGAAGALWTTDVILALKQLIPPETHGLVDCSTACLTILTGTWLIVANFWEKYRAAQAAARDEEEKDRYKIAERVAVQTILAIHGEDCILSQPPTEHLRAV